MKNPAKSSGAVGEFYKWCTAGPNEIVCGLKTDSGKEKYDCVPANCIVQECINEHLLKRPGWNKKEQECTECDKLAGSHTLTNHIKALKALYDHQAATHEGGYKLTLL